MKLDVCRTVYLGADELIEVRGDVEADPIDGSGQGDPAEEQDEQHEVGIGGWEIHHLGKRKRERENEHTISILSEPDAHLIYAELRNEWMYKFLLSN